MSNENAQEREVIKINENAREAVKISVTLSGQLIAAALAMLTIEVAFVGFVLGNRKVSIFFIILPIMASISFIASIFIAGKGITKFRNDGFWGDWNIEGGRAYFDWQAKFCLVGLLLFFIAIFFIGNPKAQELVKRTFEMEKRITSDKTELDLIKSRLLAIESEYCSIKQELNAFSSKLNQLTVKPMPTPRKKSLKFTKPNS